MMKMGGLTSRRRTIKSLIFYSGISGMELTKKSGRKWVWPPMPMAYLEQAWASIGPTTEIMAL